MNSFFCQIILLALQAPSTTNKHSVGVNSSVTIGILFTERHYLSIWGGILCVLCLSIIKLLSFIFIMQCCMYVQFSFLIFMEYFHGNLNSFTKRLLCEHTIAWIWETIFALLSPKLTSFSKLPLRACSERHQNSHLSSDKI